MKIKVKSHEIKITDIEDYNRGEYNIQECEFDFSNEYTGLSKIAVFSNNTETINITIVDDHCIVPSKMLENEGIVNLGVYAYEVENDELKLRYSPKPICFNVEEGSYKEGDQPTPPTPSAVEQLQAQITDNRNDIDDLQEEIVKKANIDDLSDVAFSGSYDDLTNKPSIPTKTSDLTNDSGFITKDVDDLTNYTLSSDLSTVATSGNYNDLINKPDLSVYATTTALNNEIHNRQNADTNLQSQIDAITVSSDVIDVVGTYQELEQYDTSHVKANDIIKVLMDSTHNNALSYYRWVITNHVGTWIYVGSEGPFYTKSETDSLLNDKQDTIDSSHKIASDLVEDTNQTHKFVTQQEKTTWNNKSDFSGNYNDLTNKPDLTVYEEKSNKVTSISSNSTDTQYPSAKCMYDSQMAQNDEIERANMVYNAMPKVSGEGTSLSLNNTAECPVYDIELSPSKLEQETTTGKNKFNINALSGNMPNATISDDTLTLTGTNDYHSTNAGTNLSNIANLVVGQTYILTFNTTYTGTNSTKMYLRGIQDYWQRGSSLTITQEMLDDRIAFYGTNNSVISNLMIRLSTESDTYEKYSGGNPSPNPDYPQDIHVVSGDNSVVVGNKNLFDKNNINVVNAYPDYESGTFKSSSQNRILWLPCKTSTDYTIQKVLSKRFGVCFSETEPSVNSSFIKATYTLNNNATTMTKLSTNTSKYLIMYVANYNEANETAWQDILDSIMVEEGTTATTYEPHKEQTYPLTLDTLEYCKIGDYEDEFYKATESDTGLTAGKWYLKKNVGKVVFNGTENWTMWDISNVNTQRFYLDLSNNGVSTATAKSDKFYYLVSNDDVEHYRISQSPNMLFNEIVIFVNRSRLSEVTASALKGWMSDNNITFYRVVATPTYTLLNNTLQTQLDNIQKAITYQEQTNVSQTNNDLPFVIKLSAIRDLNGIFELI